MKNLISYADKRVIVAGCFSGMGEATARVAAGLGAEVIGIDIKKPTIEVASFLEVDLRDPSAIEGSVKNVSASGPIDALFYCAGLPGGSFSDLDVMLVNYIGMKQMSEACIPHMKRGDAIGSISSAAGLGYLAAMETVKELVSIDDHAAAKSWVEERAGKAGFKCYSFSKMCTIVYTLSRAASLTMETGIRINCISPGPTDTPMMSHFIKNVGKDFMDKYPKPIGRNSTAEEQAWPLVFLNSAAASYISGVNLYTDGGTAGGLMTGSVDLSALAPGGN